MFWFRKIRKKKFDWELNLISEEISRSKRFGFHFGILAIKLSDSSLRGLSKQLPGKTLSWHLLAKNLRFYDRIVNLTYKVYIVTLPQSRKDEINTVQKRIHKLAQDSNWGEISIGSAVYPEDGEDAKTLLNKAIGEEVIF